MTQHEDQKRLLRIKTRSSVRHCTCTHCDDIRFLLMLLDKEVIWASTEAEYQANQEVKSC